MPWARECDVGVLAMRPISHGALCSADAVFEYLWANGVHVAMRHALDGGLNKNVGIAEREPEPERCARAEAIEVNGCRVCHLCSCSKGVHIQLLLQLWNSRSAERGWQK